MPKVNSYETNPYIFVYVPDSGQMSMWASEGVTEQTPGAVQQYIKTHKSIREHIEACGPGTVVIGSRQHAYGSLPVVGLCVFRTVIEVVTTTRVVVR